MADSGQRQGKTESFIPQRKDGRYLKSRGSINRRDVAMRNLQRVGWDPDEKPVKKPTASPALLKGGLAVMKARVTPPAWRIRIRSFFLTQMSRGMKLASWSCSHGRLGLQKLQRPAVHLFLAAVGFHDKQGNVEFADLCSLKVSTGCGSLCDRARCGGCMRRHHARLSVRPGGVTDLQRRAD